MKKFILLGLLILASLSFAKGEPENWMQVVQARYSCNIMYLGGPGHSLMNIAESDIRACGTYFNCDGMHADITILGNILYSGDCMCENAGCWDGTDTAGFRSNMLSYSATSAHFRSLFLSGLRAYLADADSGERADVLSVLQSGQTDYRTCVGLNMHCNCP